MDVAVSETRPSCCTEDLLKRPFPGDGQQKLNREFHRLPVVSPRAHPAASREAQVEASDPARVAGAPACTSTSQKTGWCEVGIFPTRGVCWEHVQHRRPRAPASGAAQPTSEASGYR
jgi:hypothetical protein